MAPQPKAARRVQSGSKERSPPNTNYKMPNTGSKFMLPSGEDIVGSDTNFQVIDVVSEEDGDKKLAEELDKLPKRAFSPKGATKKKATVIVENPLIKEKQ